MVVPLPSCAGELEQEGLDAAWCQSVHAHQLSLRLSDDVPAEPNHDGQVLRRARRTASDKPGCRPYLTRVACPEVPVEVEQLANRATRYRTSSVTRFGVRGTGAATIWRARKVTSAGAPSRP